jgi:hypothetical protein
MADNEIFMDVTAVKGMSSRFGDMGENLNRVSSGIEATLTALKMSAFVGNFGSFVMEHYLKNLKNTIDDFAGKCEEMAGDLQKSAEAYERGDAAGAERFH